MRVNGQAKVKDGWGCLVDPDTKFTSQDYREKFWREGGDHCRGSYHYNKLSLLDGMKAAKDHKLTAAQFRYKLVTARMEADQEIRLCPKLLACVMWKDALTIEVMREQWVIA
jgi:hypothetical protein